MNKIIFAFSAVAILSAGFASQAQAAPRSHSNHTVSSNYRGSSYVNHGRYANYNINYGTRFAHGYYYTGRTHNHWSYTRFDARYGCTCYYDPCCSSWYYWCQPANCYYPVSYCPYRTYCGSSGSCGSVRSPIVNVAPSFRQAPLSPVGPVESISPGGNGPIGNGPVGPGSPGLNSQPVGGPQSNDGPPIPAPVTPPRS